MDNFVPETSSLEPAPHPPNASMHGYISGVQSQSTTLVVAKTNAHTIVDQLDTADLRQAVHGAAEVFESYQSFLRTSIDFVDMIREIINKLKA